MWVGLTPVSSLRCKQRLELRWHRRRVSRDFRRYQRQTIIREERLTRCREDVLNEGDCSRYVLARIEYSDSIDYGRPLCNRAGLRIGIGGPDIGTVQIRIAHVDLSRQGNEGNACVGRFVEVEESS